jgi:hypothetical protein
VLREKTVSVRSINEIRKTNITWSCITPFMTFREFCLSPTLTVKIIYSSPLIDLYTITMQIPAIFFAYSWADPKNSYGKARDP